MATRKAHVLAVLTVAETAAVIAALTATAIRSERASPWRTRLTRRIREVNVGCGSI